MLCSPTPRPLKRLARLRLSSRLSLRRLPDDQPMPFSIPTIGIGAGAGCDGQILVYQDMLGMFSDFTPKFVKRYANVGEVMREAFANYAAEVVSGAFPTEEHTYKIKDDVLEKLY